MRTFTWTIITERSIEHDNGEDLFILIAANWQALISNTNDDSEKMCRNMASSFLVPLAKLVEADRDILVNAMVDNSQ